MDTDFSHLRAIERPHDDRDVLLGGVQAPVAIPATFLPDDSWLQRCYQGKTFWCGEHSGAHFKAVLDHYQNLSVSQRKSPRYGAIKLKSPSSPVRDGYGLDAGTDMRSIFKWLQKVGATDFEPLENNITLPSVEFCNASVVTPAMDANAANSRILSYAFGNTDFESLCQSIFQNKAVILLIHCDNGFWNTATPTFTSTPYTHFVVADGYSENGVRIIDSAEPDEAFSRKIILKQFITPQFILESGTALDIPPPAVVAPIVEATAEIVQEVSESPEPVQEKETLLEAVEQVLEKIETIL